MTGDESFVGFGSGVIIDPDGTTPDTVRTGPITARQVETWWGAYRQFLIGGVPVDAATIEQLDPGDMEDPS